MYFYQSNKKEIFTIASIGSTLILLVSLLVTSVYINTINTPQEIHSLAASANAVVLENQKQGDFGWEVTNGSYHGEIQAYTNVDSINRGGSVDLFVSTNHGQNYDASLYRLGYYGGFGGRLIQNFPNNQGIAQGYYLTPNQYPTNCSTCITSYKDSLNQETNIVDANWKKTLTVSFDSSLISGIYVVKLTEQETHRQWEVPIVVRDDNSHSSILYLDPDFTDQAYNDWGGTSLYANYRGGSDAYYVSFNRPYRLSSGLGMLLFWTYQMDRFLEQNGYDVTYTTDMAISSGYSNLLQHSAFIEAGHNEYITNKERVSVENALASKTSVGYFGANDMYWQVRLQNDEHGNSGRWIIGYKDYPYAIHDPYDKPGNPNLLLSSTQWRLPPLNDPESKILKSQYINYPYDANHPINVNFVIQNANNWIYTGTGVKNGDTISGIVGYEVDTLDTTFGISTSSDKVTVIGHSPFYLNGTHMVISDSVLDEKSNGTIMFNAATIFWDASLTDFPLRWSTGQNPVALNPILVKMTNNILAKMIGGAPQITPTPPTTTITPPSTTVLPPPPVINDIDNNPPLTETPSPTTVNQIVQTQNQKTTITATITPVSSHGNTPTQYTKITSTMTPSNGVSKGIITVTQPQQRNQQEPNGFTETLVQSFQEHTGVYILLLSLLVVCLSPFIIEISIIAIQRIKRKFFS